MAQKLVETSSASRQQMIRAYCPNIYTVNSSLLLLLVGKLTPLYTFFLTPCRPEGHEIRHQEIIMIPGTLEYQIILGLGLLVNQNEYILHGFPKVGGSNPSSGVFPPKLSGPLAVILVHNWYHILGLGGYVNPISTRGLWQAPLLK